ncbi:CHAT domain-containing protein [Nocardia sp. NRRL S-836]|uniref:CHAT domain-containing protein n=1 Tax=Nocardia sp. NRRL S-836 TaxID=1519492 RepID=UPI0006AF122C|nr:CHAT domain-containing protein [Nocardia sp. NRRL S-836]
MTLARAEQAKDLAYTSPARARRLAEAVLDGASARDPETESVALHALGMAASAVGRLDEAERHLRAAVSVASSAGLVVRAAQARGSFGYVLTLRGRTAEALRALEAVPAQVDGVTAARLRMQRALVLTEIGRFDEAAAGFADALACNPGDPLLEATIRNNRGLLRAQRRDWRGAADDLDRAEQLYLAAGHTGRTAMVFHNRGVAFEARGDLPAALAAFDEAAARYAAAGRDPGLLPIERAEALLSVRLVAEARTAAAAAVAAFARQRNSVDLVQARLLLARVALVAGDPAAALAEAVRAGRSARRQDRPGWAAFAGYLALRARWELRVAGRASAESGRGAAGGVGAGGGGEGGAQETVGAGAGGARETGGAGAVAGSVPAEAAAQATSGELAAQAVPGNGRAAGGKPQAARRASRSGQVAALRSARRVVEALVREGWVVAALDARLIVARLALDLAAHDPAARPLPDHGVAADCDPAAHDLATPHDRPDLDLASPRDRTTAHNPAVADDPAVARNPATAHNPAAAHHRTTAHDPAAAHASAADHGSAAHGTLAQGYPRTGNPCVSTYSPPPTRSSRERFLALARAELTAVAGAARTGPAELRARAWHATALLRLADGDTRGAEAALRSGVDVLAAFRNGLGATELRAHASGLAGELVATGMKLALDGGKAAAVFGWAERWRAGALRMRPVRPPGDDRLADDLAELRQVMAAGDLRRQAELEQAIRARARHATGIRAADALPSRKELSAALHDQVLVEYVESDGWLHALVLERGRFRLRDVGRAQDVGREVEALRFGINHLAHRIGSERTRKAIEERLGQAAERLDRLVPSGSAPLVVVPTGALHALPWPALPSCRGRAVTVAPSAALWLRAANTRHAPGRTVLAAGPGLGHAVGEVEALSRRYPRAERFTGRRATTANLLTALDGAELAHIAAHGRFRADNPLFSTLTLADGPLTVYDLEGLHRPPRQVILSACESGSSGIRPGDELLGLAAALLALGTRTLIASAVSVPDDTSKALMLRYHRELAGGREPAQALAKAQRTWTEAVFQCYGASSPLVRAEEEP